MAFLYHQADYVFWQSNFCKLSANKFLGKRIGPGEFYIMQLIQIFLNKQIKKIKILIF